MKTEAVGALLPALSRPQGDAMPPPPDPASSERFAALLATPEVPGSPAELLQAQAQLMSLSMGSDLTAKVAGLCTQAINKLVHMQ
ncbi:type III secretion system inner rod subunit SctI [Paludibacterium purpuratum]|uniref:Type III secretion system major needle protein (YscF/MxiH/PrgI family) n=1 Tax=Paludibacterium purpuratum TaxID=1144873 RepID=A0A4V3DUR3_9NEIS|nr:type III secretion system inner rod subunit SctI [Paludibacterium purpuratum]TDR76587.1 type III secretion system major needle protein (YscF/MxiH/PrgI family) [Paludibacterium purpuratum]